MVGANPVGVIFSETAQHRPDAWDYIRPILAENGGWALFNGTPRGKNWFFKLYDMARQNLEWFCELLTVDDTSTTTAEDIEAERKSGMREEMIQQEFFCDWSAALPGAIYGKVIEEARRSGRITAFAIESSCPVHTWWDLGSPRHTVVWYWQIVGREIRMIDIDMGHEETITQRVSRMLQKPYKYGKHFLPQDAMQTERTGLTLRDELLRVGLANLVVVPKTQDVWVGVNHAIEMFPAIAFRSPRCDMGVEALSAYPQHIEEQGQLTRSEPVGDWASHPADAFRTMAEANRAGLVQFKHSSASVLSDAEWYRQTFGRWKRRGAKLMRVSATY